MIGNFMSVAECLIYITVYFALSCHTLTGFPVLSNAQILFAVNSSQVLSYRCQQHKMFCGWRICRGWFSNKAMGNACYIPSLHGQYMDPLSFLVIVEWILYWKWLEIEVSVCTLYVTFDWVMTSYTCFHSVSVVKLFYCSRISSSIELLLCCPFGETQQLDIPFLFAGVIVVVMMRMPARWLYRSSFWYSAAICKKSSKHVWFWIKPELIVFHFEQMWI
jgi:hypothetical protein